jgi:hypothetical protein
MLRNTTKNVQVITLEQYTPFAASLQRICQVELPCLELSSTILFAFLSRDTVLYKSWKKELREDERKPKVPRTCLSANKLLPSVLRAISHKSSVGRFVKSAFRAITGRVELMREV